MTVKLLFFGPIADEIGERCVSVDQPRECTSQSLIDTLKAEHPPLNRYRLLLAVNQQYATGKEIIRDDDEVAVFTAVSGG